jgi:hypothetical protein
MGSRTQFKSGKPCLNWNQIAVLYNLWPKKAKNQGQSMVMFRDIHINVSTIHYKPATTKPLQTCKAQPSRKNKNIHHESA